MFTLQRLNVVRIVTTKSEKAKLIAEGFVEVVGSEAKKVSEVVKKVNKKV